MNKTMIAKLCWPVCAAILIIMIGCSEEDGGTLTLTPADMLPGDEDISGWVSIGAYEEANDDQGLYDIINGEAEVFTDAGFVSAAFQVYENSTGAVSSLALVHLSIYDQGSMENAIMVYDRLISGAAISWDGAGTEARIDESALAAYKIEFWEDNFYVEVIIEDKTDEALDIAKLFAFYVSSQIW